MRYKLLVMLACTLFFSLNAFAQVSVTGTVTDANSGEVIPGASIFLQEVQRGDATDLNGEFEIRNVSAGSYTLIATFVGYERLLRTIQVGTTDLTVNLQLTPSVLALDDVVVTAFGIQREARALTYGVSVISAESIGRRQESDVVRALSGKLPGVNITNTSGTTGSSTNFIIRGFQSISGSNQPLFVVDGIAFDSQTNATSGFQGGGGVNTAPNRFLDIDPKNIENVTVLRGLNATTVYGEQGRNGVVLITTKSGAMSGPDVERFEVTFEQGFTGVQIASSPTYQNEYGIGFDQAYGWFFSNWGPRFSDQNPGAYGRSFRGIDEDGTVLIEHPFSRNTGFTESFPELAASNYRYQAYGDPIDAFFRTGVGNNTSFNISGGTGDLRLNVNYSRSFEEGFTPGNDMERNSFSVGANYRISERFTSRTSFNMALSTVNQPPNAAGFGSNPSTPAVFANVFYTPRSIDLAGLPFTDPITNGPVYYRSGNDIQNPFWTVANHTISNVTDRYFGRSELTYEVLDGLSAIYRVGYDNYTENYEERMNRGNVVNDDLAGGLYQTFKTRSVNWEHNFNLLYDTQITEDISFNGLLGAQYSQRKWERDGLDSQNQIVFDFFEHANFIDQSSANSFTGGDIQFRSERQTAGVFADLTLGFRDYVYLNLSARNDWFSTLEVDNRSILYPSASLSFIVSDAFNITNDYLTFLKVFGGVGTSAGSPTPYSTRNVLGTNARSFVNQTGSVFSTNNTSGFLGNPGLKAELHTEWEFGVESRFFEGRAGLDVTYYHKTTNDLITRAPLDPSTGFTSTFINIGEVENRGLEVVLSGTPIATEFRWDLSANFFTDASEVKELGAGLEEIAIAGFGNQGNFAIVGQTLGIMQGDVVERNAEGRPIVGTDGNYVQASEIGIIGNPNPQYTMGISNTFSYRGASLSFQVDYQHGGDIFSTWISTLFARGLTEETARVDRNNTFILPGVRPDGSENTVQIPISAAMFSNFGFGIDELRVYDASHVRLSEISVSYDLPLSIIEATPFSQVTLSLNGNNLWFFAPNIPEGSGFDPNVNSLGVGNGRGFEYLTGPSARRFGGSIRVRL